MDLDQEFSEMVLPKEVVVTIALWGVHKMCRATCDNETTKEKKNPVEWQVLSLMDKIN